MIIGMGIDFVSVSRITHWLQNEALCQRFFHPEELRYIHSSGVQAARSLAARFAAKEAFVKALGSGFAGLFLKDIRVKNEQSGRPQLILEGSAFDAMIGIGARWVHMSLTHEGDLAAAQVILEG